MVAGQVKSFVILIIVFNCKFYEIQLVQDICSVEVIDQSLVSKRFEFDDQMGKDIWNFFRVIKSLADCGSHSDEDRQNRTLIGMELDPKSGSHI